MAIINRMAELHDEITAWRRSYHANPELMYDVHDTAGDVAEKLKAFGCDEVVTGIGRTGVVGVIRGSQAGGRVVGLRADMDALPIREETGLPYASKNDGKMHACGHDGHTAMLLGAAQYLAETRNFAGTAIVIFQPAEEGGAGGEAMVKDGLMERFGIEEVYGLHNMPGLDVGKFAICEGPIMASTDEFTITIKGRGSHAAMPHQGVDPIVAGAQLVNAFQTIPSRNVHPLDGLVVSVTQFHAGNTYNVIPETAMINGTIRSLNNETRKFAEQRLRSMIDLVTQMAGASFELDFRAGYPVTVNDGAATRKAIEVAKQVAGDSGVDPQVRATLGGEDFAYMLNARPGAYIFMGNGDTAGLHHPAYDFNDEAIPHGTSYWAKLVETLMPAS
ncbi:M20 aminoacylase family protein [Salaquimonas pukyongi]|uniref:M20 aminoacylase family protein n=1 Tax=Salaquimonas pukyongi TaxID=2712698 RepID=UPI00096B7A85|nr:M20 aminoacylase family protein [Salaquimonas pukyongi]